MTLYPVNGDPTNEGGTYMLTQEQLMEKGLKVKHRIDIVSYFMTTDSPSLKIFSNVSNIEGLSCYF